MMSAKEEDGGCCNNTKATLLAPWHAPSPEKITHNVGLRIMNSLTRQKDLFITMDGSRHVRWYMCGPTVYAPSHMGHARTYLGFDIIRRILTDYFSYDVTLIMNITDIDDKIIQRANENSQSHLELARQFENEFHVDMKQLNVLEPTILTRVTEYMKEIVDYIQVILEKDLAYESNGSVYFHVKKFESLQPYCKLAPEQILNAELLAEGEGKLSCEFVSEKRSPRDFALWKKSKPDEPQWESPWGPGRPGWHIECSVMAGHVLKQLAEENTKNNTDNTPVINDSSCMDIHSGGIDLKFPHHDNEMAQAEAHSGCRQWVNYFVHAGHLHIKGFKMSKSLKNFITIQQALEQHSARQIRWCFLGHKYNDPMDYGDETMHHALVQEKTFAEFFLNVKVKLRELDDTNIRWNDDTMTLHKQLQQVQAKVDAALRDDFDTPAVMTALTELVKQTNLYMNKNDAVVGDILISVAKYITRIFRVFGLIQTTTDHSFGMDNHNHHHANNDGVGNHNNINREQTLAPVLDALVGFRSEVRDNARNNDTKSILQACDQFRDDKLPPLGIRLEDKEGRSIWKLSTLEEYEREQKAKQAQAMRKQEQKQMAAAIKEKKDAMNKLTPAEYMKQQLDDTGRPKYTKFQEDTGMPTHNADGEPLNKNQSKKAQKEYQAQQKKYEKYCQQQQQQQA